MATEPILIVIAVGLLALIAFRIFTAVKEGTASAAATPMQFIQPIPEGLEGRIKQLLDSNKKIEAIKEVRTALGLGLKQAKELVDAMATGSSLSELTGPAHKAASNTVAIVSEQSMDAVRQKLKQGKKIEAIKLYREITGVGLKEANDAITKMDQQ